MRSTLSSETMPRLNTRRRPAQGEVAAPQREAAQHRGRGRIAGDVELAAHLGIEAAAAHEHGLRRLHVELEPHGVADGGGGARARRWSGGGAGARARPVDLAHLDGGKAADCEPPMAISARSIVIGPATSMPRHVEPVTLRSLDTVASRSGRLTSSARRLVTARSTGKPCAGSSRTVPLADSCRCGRSGRRGAGAAACRPAARCALCRRSAAGPSRARRARHWRNRPCRCP